MDTPAGTYIQFACAENQAAFDGAETERNSLFTKHLLKHIQSSNDDITTIFRRVRTGVIQESHGTQKPLGIDGLTHDGFIYLNDLTSVKSGKKLQIGIVCTCSSTWVDPKAMKVAS